MYAKMGHILVPQIGLTPVMYLTSGDITSIPFANCVWLPGAICQLPNTIYTFRLIAHVIIFIVRRHCVRRHCICSPMHVAASMCGIVCGLNKLRCVVLHAGWAAMQIRQRRLLKRGDLVCSALRSTWGCKLCGCTPAVDLLKHPS